jgi:hypothetical protein
MARKVMVVNFWARVQEPCRRFPNLSSWEKFGDKLVFIGIAVDQKERRLSVEHRHKLSSAGRRHDNDAWEAAGNRRGRTAFHLL